MKKALALVMAIAMVASMAAVSFATVAVVPAPGFGTAAAGNQGGQFYTYTSTNAAGAKWAFAPAKLTFGDVVYLPLVDNVTADGHNLNRDKVGYVTEADAVKGLKLDVKFETGAEYVKSVEIVKVDGCYAIAFTTTGSSTKDVEVLAELALKGKSYYETNAGKTASVKVDKKFNVELDIGYAVETLGAAATAVTGNVTTKKIYDFTAVTDTEDFSIAFGKTGDILVETDVKNMKKVVLGCSEKDNEELLDAYVDANLSFYNCTAAFRRTAEVLLYAEEGSYLYEVVDGSLVPVDAEYDVWEGAFSFKTRTLGNYVVSDMELVVEEVAVANPSTGAAA